MTKRIESLTEKVGKHCKMHRQTLVTVESCTGGGIAYHLSRSTECSSILERGYVTYSQNSKENVIGVKSEVLQLHGAVSKQVAIEMAEGALKNSIAQVSVAVTGIAGEDKEDDNEGIAWIAVAVIDYKTVTHKVTFVGSREKFIDHVITESLAFLYDSLEQII